MAFDVSRFGLAEDDLPPGWTANRFDTLASINPEQIGPDYRFSEIAYLDISNVARGAIGQPARLALAAAPGRARRIVRPGDSVLATVRPGNRAYAFLRSVPDNLIVSTGFAVLRAKPGADPRYVYYLATSDPIVDYLAAIAEEKTAYPAVNPNDLAACVVPIPSLPEQQVISRVLGALDDKIELNIARNNTLDALARGLFERGVALTHENGSASVGTLGDHVEVTRGLSYTGAGLGSGLPLHNLNSIREGGGYKRDGIKYYSGEYRERHTVRPGDVIVANTDLAHKNRIIGYPAIVPRRFGTVGLFSHHIYRVRPKAGSPLTPAFIYLLLRSEPLRSTVAGYANGTTVNMLPADALARPTFLLPPPERIRALDAQVTPLLARIEANEDENETLAALRDALLPKLVSGELRLREAEAVAAAT